MFHEEREAGGGQTGGMKEEAEEGRSSTAGLPLWCRTPPGGHEPEMQHRLNTTKADEV